ncbi:MAG: SDR family oxidoreductase [Bacillota bacterium]
MTDTILKGSFFCAQSVARVMKEQGQGRIINIGSATCALGTEGIIPYGAAKGGLLQLTKGLAVEWGKYGITVNIVAPGWFKTKQSEEMYENRAWVEKVKERIPLDRIGGEHDLDGITVFLASDYSEYITGQILYVDGGYTVSAVKAIDRD